MHARTINRVIIFNLIVIGLIALDLCLPAKEEIIQELECFYQMETSNSHQRGGRYSSGTVIRSLVGVTNGESYLIGRLPKEDYPKGMKIKITRSAIAGNVNKVLLLEDNKWTELSVGLFSNWYLFYSLIASLLVTVASLYFRYKYLILILLISAFFLFLISGLYFLYYPLS